MESESENLKYKQKCKDLQKRIKDINVNNEVTALAITKTKQTIQRLRLEYFILLERLEQKALSKDISEKDSYSVIKSPEIPSLNVAEVSNANAANMNRKSNKNAKIKAKQKERDPNLPKRPTNSYLIFCELEKDKIKQKLDAESKDGHVQDMSKALTEAWKNLSEEEKKPYYKLYEEEKEKYAKELRSYNEEKSRVAAESALAALNAVKVESKELDSVDEKEEPMDETTEFVKPDAATTTEVKSNEDMVLEESEDKPISDLAPESVTEPLSEPAEPLTEPASEADPVSELADEPTPTPTETKEADSAVGSTDSVAEAIADEAPLAEPVPESTIPLKRSAETTEIDEPAKVAKTE